MNKTFSIKTLGCKLNQYESSAVAARFLQNGWIAKPFGEAVDVVIINTCTVTDRSDKKCRNYIRQGARFSIKGKAIVIGCLAERNMKSLEEMPEVLSVLGNNEKELVYSRVIELYNEYNDSNSLSHGIVENNNSIEAPIPFFHTRGYIKIQNGCDGECSYCIVPSVRGTPESRKFNDILDHARKLIDKGCPELILTGITIGKYLDDNRDLSELIEKIITLNGKFRVRITSIEPNHVTDKLINIFQSERLCSHIHIPLQSGSDNILRMMKRPYSAQDYMNIIDKIKSLYPKIAIGTDIIIGFPGEQDVDFQHSIKMIKRAEFSYVHQFTFSTRSNTAASKLKQDTNSQEIRKRAKIMRDIQNKVGLEYRKEFENKLLSSVIEKNRNRDGFSAMSDNYIKISLNDSPLNKKMMGEIADVQLLNAGLEKNVGYLPSA